MIRKELEIEGPEGKTTASVIFDSGSSISGIRKDVAEKIGFAPLQITRKWKTADKTADKTFEGVSPVNLRINGCELSDLFLVAPDFTEEVIVGVDIMQKRKLIIDMEKEDVDVSKYEMDRM